MLALILSSYVIITHSFFKFSKVLSDQVDTDQFGLESQMSSIQYPSRKPLAQDPTEQQT